MRSDSPEQAYIASVDAYRKATYAHQQWRREYHRNTCGPYELSDPHIEPEDHAEQFRLYTARRNATRVRRLALARLERAIRRKLISAN